MKTESQTNNDDWGGPPPRPPSHHSHSHMPTSHAHQHHHRSSPLRTSHSSPSLNPQQPIHGHTHTHVHAGTAAAAAAGGGGGGPFVSPLLRPMGMGSHGLKSDHDDGNGGDSSDSSAYHSNASFGLYVVIFTLRVKENVFRHLCVLTILSQYQGVCDQWAWGGHGLKFDHDDGNGGDSSDSSA